MRILVAYPYLPYPLDRGTFQRTFNLLKALGSEHAVDFFYLSEDLIPSANESRFSPFCQRIAGFHLPLPVWPKLFPTRLCSIWPTTVSRWYSPAAASRLDAFVAQQQYDIVYVCDIVMAQYFVNGRCPAVSSAKLVIDRSRVDMQFQLAQAAVQCRGVKQRLLDWENLLKLWLCERRFAASKALQVLGGQDDADFVSKFFGRSTPTYVLPNGVDPAFFSLSAVPPVPRDVSPTVLFCGAMDYMPNVDALRWFFHPDRDGFCMHCALLERIPDLQVLIVGRSPLPEVSAYGDRQGVVVTGGVPDVRPYYQRAWLQVVPLRVGGGSRLKIPESLALRTPVVSTTIGAQGLGLVPDREIILVDTARDFVDRTVYWLQHDRTALESAGFAAVHSRLTWSALGTQLSRRLQRFVSPVPPVIRPSAPVLV